MPYLCIQTNQSPDADTCDQLVSQASALVSALLGKSESYVMVAIQPNVTMRFAGNPKPLAYLELKSIGLPEDKTPTLSQALTELVANSLAITPARIYIEFSNSPRHLWGWDGQTF